MKLTFSAAAETAAPALAALHTAVAADLTLRYGRGFWSSVSTERGVLFSMRHSRILIAKNGKKIVGTLRLATKKPWAIDVSYFTPVKKAIYLTSMAVIPAMQRHGIGRLLLDEAVRQARAWPADAIRLDAFDPSGLKRTGRRCVRLRCSDKRAHEFAFHFGGNRISVNSLRAQKLSGIFHFIYPGGFDRYLLEAGRRQFRYVF
jgi:GNAT superfamily N-acetyltransferase